MQVLLATIGGTQITQGKKNTATPTTEGGTLQKKMVLKTLKNVAHASKNGSLLSASGSQKFQATAAPGPKEKEIVELFRKVQAKLRERAAMKEEKKVEDTQGKGKENGTADSLLQLLRKHSVQQGKKNANSASNYEFMKKGFSKLKTLTVPVTMNSCQVSWHERISKLKKSELVELLNENST